MEGKGVYVKPLAPYTQDQNNGAKRLKGVIKDKIRVIGTLFPNKLWPKIYKITVYLVNKTPRYFL